MSDPNMDAADAHCALQEMAYADFQSWCDENAGDDDLTVLADKYAEACESGAWVVGCRMPTLADLKEPTDG